MKHLFCPYNISLLAKEKGFDEDCLTFYEKDLNKPYQYILRAILATTFLNAPYPNTHFYNDLFTGYKNSVKPFGSEIVTAPLYQQLVDWLREKHKIRIVDAIREGTMSNSLETKFQFKVVKIDGLYTKDMLYNIGKDDLIYPSYYEALTKALQEAFKLI